MFRRATGFGGAYEQATTGVLPVYSEILGNNNVKTVKKKCTSSSIGGDDEVAVLLQGILPELPVGRARFDNRRLVQNKLTYLP